MKILFVSFEPINSGSSASTLSNALLGGLIELDHDIEILTLERSVYAKNKYWDILMENCDFSFAGKRISGNNVNMQTPTINKNSVNYKIKKVGKELYRKISIYNYSFFYLKYIKSGIVKKNHYDIVISTSDPITSHKAVDRLRKLGIHFDMWIQHWGDPLAADINKRSIWPRWVLKRIERGILKKADKIVYVSPFTAKNAKTSFPEFSRKICYVLPPSEFTRIFEIRNDNTVNVAYCGIYDSKIRNILPLYHAVSNNDNFSLTIAGNSDVKLDQKKNVQIFGHIPHEKAIEIEWKSDLIACILNKAGTQIPAKLYYYVGTNKPILVIYEDGNKDVVEFLKTFHRFEFAHNDIASIHGALTKLGSNKEAIPSQSLSPSAIAAELIRRTDEN